MKQIYFFLLTFLSLSIGTFAQSSWFNTAANYVGKDIVVDKAFACHDILGNNLYAIDSDGLYCYDLTTMEQTHNFGKVPEYSGWVSFVTADTDGTKVWLGYTTGGLTDDRIYSVDIGTGTWTHEATFPGNFDMECYNGNYYVSGLNTEGWDGVNDVNCISLLDLSGNNDHKKLIEVGGNSTGLAIDSEGSVFNAVYSPTGETSMYKWEGADIKAIIDAADNSYLTLTDGTELTLIAGNGPYDCDVDAAGHLIFNSNDFTSGSYVAVWDGNIGQAQNYNKIGTYGGSSFAWFGMLKATGDITADGKVYACNLGDPLAEVRLSKAPAIARPVNDILLPKNAPQTIINLSDYFTVKEGEIISYAVASEANEILLATTIDDSGENPQLNIDYVSGKTGIAQVTVTASSSGDASELTFIIELRDIDYSNGVFIVNEDWFGHSEGTVSYLASDDQFVYRAYRQQNEGKTLGTTTQFGCIYGNQFYFISKQGNRLVAADAANMQEQTTVAEFNQGNSADGRAFVGVSPEKGYISTSNGIYLFDIAQSKVGAIVEGTGGEVGIMVRAGAYVFAVKKSEVYIIDAATDRIEKTITGTTYGAVVQAFDGQVYIAAGTQLIKVNPYTLQEEVITMPEGIEIPSSFGFAWSANSFCASATENALYWAKPAGWSGSTEIYKYIIGDDNSLSMPFVTLEEGMELYGAGIRVHPSSNLLYATGMKSGWGHNSQYNTLYVFNGTDGAEVSRHPLDPYYWFTAMPVFPDAFLPEFNLADLTFTQGDNSQSIALTSIVSDVDNNDASILVSVVSNSDASVATATIEKGQLLVSPVGYGSASITLRANSNGNVVEESFDVTVSVSTDVEDTKANDISIYPVPFDNYIHINGSALGDASYSIVNLSGRVVQNGMLNAHVNRVNTSDLANGSYIIRVKSAVGVVTQKAVKQ
ncbi:Por secretion system C-terminal sorting domain-containing protein [Saccharicrinis carchari]|uniref:Por secretion system C-terminal sorting domain-containing protein n=1 Tax=Saccharicrinis carchari TaxID=1168039 RepID=A0A521AJP1_SACCC|nr:DUF5074 domain-containing protein [Saccharicrinis carchari]SMO35026.1 Por secretion system C-terminal sorting domain-containing protein [Saccharicrinis carchari]